jgi:hypothetical protein
MQRELKLKFAYLARKFCLARKLLAGQKLSFTTTKLRYLARPFGMRQSLAACCLTNVHALC